jgi:hypothetical protein
MGGLIRKQCICVYTYDTYIHAYIGGDDDDADSSGLGSINVSNILNGKSLAR